MSDPFNASTVHCSGPNSFGSTGRRGFIRMGLAGFAGLSLPGILHCKHRVRSLKVLQKRM